MPDPTRFPSGISTDGPNDLLADFPMPDPTRFAWWMDDFMGPYLQDATFDGTDTFTTWITDTTATSDFTLELEENRNGGVLIVKTGGDVDDHIYMRTPQQSVAASVPYQTIGGNAIIRAQSEIWYKVRFQPLEGAVTASAIFGQYIFGLQKFETDPSTNPFATTTEGIFFRVSQDDFSVQLHVGDGNETESILVLSGDDYTGIQQEWGWRYRDGTVTAYVNGKTVGSFSPSFLPSAPITPIVAHRNGSDAGNDNQDLHLDYVFVASDRSSVA